MLVKRLKNRDSGFTLIELLVVIAIIIALAGITLLFYPKREVRLAAQGAEQLQTYIAGARSRALRDQSPRGIRLKPDATTGKFTEVQLIEVPEPIVPANGTVMTIPPPASTAVTTSTATFSTGLDALGLKVGDFLEILHGAGSIHRITGTAGAAITGTTLPLASKVPAAEIAELKLSTNYRFVRQARPLMGEPPLQLPNTVFVMANSAATAADSVAGSRNIPITVNGNCDILFSPSGQVINSSTGRIVLWVTDDNGVSKPTLLTVYARTGSVASHPAGPAANLFQYTKDGKSSGQ